MSERISIGKVITGAVAVVIDRWSDLIRALAILFVVSVLLGWLPLEPENALLVGIVAGISLVVQTIFAIVTHRVVLKGAESVPRWGLGGWGQREMRFILHLLGLSLFAGFVVLLGTALPLPLTVLVGLGVATVFSSLSLIFPAIAVEDDLDLFGAWRLGEGYRLLMVVAVCIFPIALATPFVGIAFMLPAAVAVVAPIFQGLMTIFTVSALSVAYAELQRVKGSG